MQTTTIRFAGQDYPVSSTDVMRLILAQQDHERAEEASKFFGEIVDSVQKAFSMPAMPTLLAKIGDDLQGGIYAGPRFNMERRRFEHVIAAKELASGDHSWNNDKAEQAARAYRGGGYADWRLPTKEHGHLLQTYLQPMGKLPKKVCWTSTPFGSSGAWALDFECGDVGGWLRYIELAVLPVRIITA